MGEVGVCYESMAEAMRRLCEMRDTVEGDSSNIEQ